MSRNILIVEDDHDLAAILKKTISRQFACNCVIVSTLRQAKNLSEDDEFAAIVLDRHLSDGDGLKLIKMQATVVEPSRYLIVSRISQVEEREKCLLIGAFDYLVKPFSKIELVEKIKRILALNGGFRTEMIAIDRDIKFWPGENKLEVEGQAHSLTSTDSKLLFYLYRANDIVTREELRREVWDERRVISENALNSKIYRLRKKLGKCGKKLKTYNQYGYQLLRTTKMITDTKIS